MSIPAVPTAPPAGDLPSGVSPTSVDLWKHFEEHGSKLKDSMFSMVTWMIGVASVVLGFAVKEGFAEGSALTSVRHPAAVVGLCIAGLLVLRHAGVVIRDYGDHINRTFNRADAARRGDSSPESVWAAGETAVGGPLPPVCQPLLRVVHLFRAAFVVLIVLALVAVIRYGFVPAQGVP